MPQNIDLRHAFNLPPEDVIAYFRSKGYAVSFNWWDLWQDAHARAFTIAKATGIDILEAIRAVFDEGLAQGLQEREIVSRLEPELVKRGWWGTLPLLDEDGTHLLRSDGTPRTYTVNAWRLTNAWRINKRTAYNVGRHQQQMSRAEARPYWQYVAILDSRVRPSHAALNGRVYRYDDPIWQSLYPPNGWGCRCRVRALSEAAVRRRGLEVSSSAGQLTPITQRVGTDKRTGEVITAPGVTWTDPATGDTLTPDAGWAYSPGDAAARLRAELRDKAVRAGLAVPTYDPPERPRDG